MAEQEEITSEQLYEFKKKLRKLKECRGDGTQLVTVYVSAGYPINEVSSRVREEINQASNIKSKQTRTNVTDALERIVTVLKGFRKTPEKGLVIFAGNVSTDPSKQDLQTFYFEPISKLGMNVYRCDSTFFLEPLEKMMFSRDSYGVLAFEGRDATLAVLQGTEFRIVDRIHNTAHAKVRKGGQCLAAGTLITQDDGRIIDIENFMAGSSTVGLDLQSAKTIPVVASDFFITPATHSLIIRTEHPLCEIRATPYHRFFVLSEFGIKEKFAKDLGNNDRILIAKKINCRCGAVKTGFVPKTRIVLDSKERQMLREARLRLGYSQKTAAQKIGVSQIIISDMEMGKQMPSASNLRKLYGIYGISLDESRLSKRTLQLPEYWDKNLARLCGVICGDGTIDCNRIIIYEGSKEIVENYCMLVEKAIGLKPVIRTVDKTKQRGSFAKKQYFEIRIYSLEFAEAIAHVTPEIVARKRDIPEDIARCENEIVAAFLSGLYDAEGYMHGNRVDIAMTSKRLIKKVHLLLLRFGILSSFAEKKVMGNKQWFVSISDRNSVARFRQHIGFARSDKREKLRKACERISRQQYVDQIPIDGREVFRLAKDLGLKTSDFHAASSFFRNKKPLGREAFARNMLPVFDRYRNIEKGRKIADYLHRIYDSDFTFATIKEKIPVENKEMFYDITIPTYSNFIADGFVVHNSARRYERLIEESNEYYYKRVGEAMDQLFLNKVKGVIVGGPGPMKEYFLNEKTFNYQIKILGVVDTGYVDEQGIREIIEKSDELIKGQEAIKEKRLFENFMRMVIKTEKAVYGLDQVMESINSKRAELVLVSEDSPFSVVHFRCPSCDSEVSKIYKKGQEEKSIKCEKCGSIMNAIDVAPIAEYLIDLCRSKDIKVEIISATSSPGEQFLNGFGGIGAILRY
jgi:peptide subunit release factor 1 (eRF1)/transcriptional regulator with XRE-family HTH domain